MGEAVVLDQPGACAVVEARTPEFPACQREAGRMDEVKREAEAGGKPQQRARVLGYVGLIERQIDRDLMVSARGWVRTRWV